MFTRKTLVSLVMAGLSGSALAQQAGGKVDVFGRPYVNQTAEQIYYQADDVYP